MGVAVVVVVVVVVVSGVSFWTFLVPTVVFLVPFLLFVDCGPGVQTTLLRDDTGDSLGHKVVFEVLVDVANCVGEVVGEVNAHCFCVGLGDTVAAAAINPDAGRDGC